MKTKTKIWIGIGAYLLASASPMVKLSSTDRAGVDRSQSSPSLSINLISQTYAQPPDPCRKGLGGEGGEGSSESPAASLNPLIKPGELETAVIGYQTYVLHEVDRLLADAKVFTDLVIAGDVKQAKSVYGSSRLGWERIEPIAEAFEAFDNSIDVRVDEFKDENDPKFTGFHRLEMGLFKHNTTQGYEPFAKKLMADLNALKACVASLEIAPKDMVRGASELIEEVAQGKITGEEERYSRTDFWSFKANVEGSEKIVELIRPMVLRINPELLRQIDNDFAVVNQMLKKYSLPGGKFMSYDQLTPRDKQQLQADLARLAENLSKLRGVIGV
ncbi:MAG: EfeM/EfeO family lipoprotein [Scytolyngbya sp. HA4215-MV1]|nr:EfeM/EfeO family lipoprotein [Scytolyngbya sp. HA4215-MV1]